jgi:hypothetical protein
MALKEQLQKIATEKGNPCVTISLNTHRTHPDSDKDRVLLKNLSKEAEDRVIAEFGKRPVAPLLKKLETVTSDVDINYNLDSLHIFLSNDTEEIVKSTWETSSEGVHISDSFAVRPLIKSYNRSEDYLLMLLSQSGVQLYEALNDGIVGEIRNGDFPFPETRHYLTHPDRKSDPKQVDNMVREFLNKVDKALVKVANDTGLQCVVICTEENYRHLQHVADKPDVYLGYAPVDYNNTARHQIAGQAWEIIKSLQQERRTKAIEEMKEAVAHGKVLTDLQEIYQAAIDGRGDLLIVHRTFSQPVRMRDDRHFDLVDDPTQPNTIDDITSNIAWEVLSKKGRVFFTLQDEIKDLGKIVLKTRY